MPIGAMITAGYTLATKLKLGKRIQNGWNLVKKASDAIQSNKNLGDAVITGNVAVVDTGAGYLVTNKAGGQVAEGTKKYWPWALGAGLLYFISKK